MKKYTYIIILALVVLVAVVLRFYKLGEIPKGLYVDEAGQGYSAYSIVTTGKDEFGMKFPIVFRSMTDFRTPVYTYLISPLIPIFGLNNFSVRFPSFLLGVLSVYMLFLLVNKITENKQISLISAFLLAISPWHIMFSRTAFETNVSLFFLLCGLYFFYKAVEKPIFLLVSAISFSISIVAYQSERLIVPLILVVLFLRYKNILLSKTHKNFMLISLLAGFIVLLPTISIMFTPGFWARAAGLNIFSHSKHLPDGYIEGYKGIFSFVVNSSWFLSSREFLWHYFSYFSPRYMFVVGDYEPRLSFPGLSTFFIWQFPFYIYGLWLLFKENKFGPIKFVTILLLLVSPISAAITRDPYSTLRAFPLQIPQLIIISFAIYQMFISIKRSALRYSFVILFLLIISHTFFKLYSSGIILNDHYRARYWHWGWQEVVNQLSVIDPNSKVVVDNARGDVYLQLAFYLKYDPTKYQNENFEVPLSEYYTNMYHTSEKHIGNITTKPIDWKNDTKVEQYLVGDELGISLEQIKNHNLSLIAEIKYPDGSIAYRITKTNPTSNSK